MGYKDRRQAGRDLAQLLGPALKGPAPLVLGLPRGGVPVAYEVAQACGGTLDVFCVRKLGVPGHHELAMGAIASGGVVVLNENVIAFAHVRQAAIDEAIARKTPELEQLELRYRPGRPPIDVQGRSVIVVDDGLATGSTMRAALTALRQLGAKHLIAAAPVGAATTCAELGDEADVVVCPLAPHAFGSVGRWYADFAATSDDEVRRLLSGRIPTAEPDA